MTDTPRTDPACAVRASAATGGVVRLHSRSHSYAAEGQTGYGAKAEHPSALDYLLGALASDLVAGLHREAARTGTALDAAELSLAGHLDNPLVSLGVVGEEGSARLASVRGSLYVSTDASEPELRGLWEEALRKAPVHATLAACVAIEITLKLVP